MTLANKLGEGNVITDRNESWKHYMAKCILHKIIINKGCRSKIEYNYGSRIIDVVQITDEGKVFGYEMQTNNIKKKSQEILSFVFSHPLIEDIKIIDLSKLSSEPELMLLELQKEIL